jgi:hypothetical protein
MLFLDINIADIDERFKKNKLTLLNAINDVVIYQMLLHISK